MNVDIVGRYSYNEFNDKICNHAGEIVELEDCYCIYFDNDDLLNEVLIRKPGDQRIVLRLKKEVRKWLNENIEKDLWCYDDFSCKTIAFIEVESAVAFKLRWM